MPQLSQSPATPVTCARRTKRATRSRSSRATIALGSGYVVDGTGIRCRTVGPTFSDPAAAKRARAEQAHAHTPIPSLALRQTSGADSARWAVTARRRRTPRSTRRTPALPEHPGGHELPRWVHGVEEQSLRRVRRRFHSRPSTRYALGHPIIEMGLGNRRWGMRKAL